MTLIVRKVGVLGAGVMGSQIAAHFVNAQIPVVLLDVAAPGPNPYSLIDAAIERLRSLQPSAFATSDGYRWIDRGVYDRDAEKLRDCDLIIEAVAENLAVKCELYQHLRAQLDGRAVFATNTSGISVALLSRSLVPAQQEKFCGVHFFNPPRYMRLVELIPSRSTNRHVVDELESFLTTSLGKGVVRAHDTPSFIGNRIGIFALLAAIHHAERWRIPFDTVDALTGPAIGRPRSATYGTLDLIGLDTFAAIVANMARTLNDDPWVHFFRLPAWMTELIGRGSLGGKTGVGVFQAKTGGMRAVLDPEAGTYRDARFELDPETAGVLRLNGPATRLPALRAARNSQSEFLWALHRDLFHYCAAHLSTIAECAGDVDSAMRWGFGWQQGPFESWQSAGWKTTATAIAEDIATGAALARVALPDWVADMHAVYDRSASYSPATRSYVMPHRLPVYSRQYPLMSASECSDDGKTLWESEAVKLWTPGRPTERDVVVLSFKTKLGTIRKSVLEGIVSAIDYAERAATPMILWQSDGPFSAGADLNEILAIADGQSEQELDSYIRLFQVATGRLRYAAVPIVAAIEGAALGGGCEMAMHCARVVSALETKVGLVETGVGLIPGGGGCKEMAVRNGARADSAGGDALLSLLTPVFRHVLLGHATRNAREAQAIGFLSAADVVIMHPRELLYVARETARWFQTSGYRPPLPRRITRVVGRDGIAQLLEAVAGSEHDLRVARALAVALCGGDVPGGAEVDEQHLLDVERAEFVGLARTPQTRARIAHFLKRGAPLKN